MDESRFTIIVLHGSERGSNKEFFDQMFGFRHEVFAKNRKPAGSTLDAPGVDKYDDDDAIYFIELDADQRVRASMRITPTIKSSLIADHFPELIDKGKAARGPTIYELNRHVWLTPQEERVQIRETVRLLKAVLEWCLARRLSHLQILIDAAALPSYLALSPLTRPLGLPHPYVSNFEESGEIELIAVRWPICPQLLHDIGRFQNATGGASISIRPKTVN